MKARIDSTTYTRLVRLLMHKYGGGVEEDIKDAVQNAILQCLLLEPDFPTIKQSSAWLFVVAKNLLTDEWRRQKNRERLLSFALEVSEASEVIFDWQKVTILSSFNALPVDDQILLRLRDEGWRCDEIAIIVGSSIEAVKKRLQRARKRFAYQLSCRGYEMPHSH